MFPRPSIGEHKLGTVVEGSEVRFAGPLEGSLAVIMEAVRKHGLEGIVAKRRDSVYESGERSGIWQKLPLKPKDEFFIGAYRLDGERLEILLVGYFEGRKFLFAGKVHQGLNPPNRKALLKVLAPLRVTECPFANLPTGRSGHWGEGVTEEEMGDYCWVRPEVVATIKFAEWTEGGVLRHGEFEGVVEG